MAVRSNSLLDVYEAVTNTLLDGNILDVPTVEQFESIIGPVFDRGYRTFDQLVEQVLLSL